MKQKVRIVFMNEEAWENAVRLKLPYEFYPGNNTPAPVDTECPVTYNNGLRDVDMAKLNRTFFVKVGYTVGL